MTTNKELLAKRGYIKGSVTRIITFLDKFDKEKGSAAELITRLENLENKWSEYEHVFLQLASLDENDQTTIQDELNSDLEEFETMFYSAQSKLTGLIAIMSNSSLTSISHALSHNTSNSANSRFSTNSPAVKLPVISLPTFSGCYESWFSFHDTFVSLIDSNPSLSEIQKFYYLKSCLKDEAEYLLQSIDVTNDNYKIAWKLLKERFEDKQLIISKTVEALINPDYIKKESAIELRHLLDSTVKHLRVLSQLGEPTAHWDTLIIHIVLSRVDPITRREWESRDTTSITNPVKFDTLSTFLSNRCKMLESVQSHQQFQTLKSTTASQSTDNQHSTNTSKPSSPKSFTATSTTNQNLSSLKPESVISKEPLNCKICNADHLIHNCEILLKMDVVDRITEVKKGNLCLNCLRYGHFISQCTSSKCRKCNQTHNTILHIEKTDKISEVSSQQSNPEDSPEPQDTTTNICAHSVNTTQVFLPTAIVRVQDKYGAYYTCRALLDSASHSNFMSEQLCQILQLERKKNSLPILLLEGSSTQVSESVQTTIKSRINEYSAGLDFSILSSITGNLPANHVNIANWKIPTRIKLADPQFNIPNKIDMLIGAKFFFKMFSDGEIDLSSSLPTLKNTVFGWILGGEASEQIETSSSSCESKIYSCHAYSSPARSTISSTSTMSTIKVIGKPQQRNEDNHEHQRSLLVDHNLFRLSANVNRFATTTETLIGLSQSVDVQPNHQSNNHVSETNKFVSFFVKLDRTEISEIPWNNIVNYVQHQHVKTIHRSFNQIKLTLDQQRFHSDPSMRNKSIHDLPRHQSKDDPHVPYSEFSSNNRNHLVVLFSDIFKFYNFIICVFNSDYTQLHIEIQSRFNRSNHMKGWHRWKYKLLHSVQLKEINTDGIQHNLK